MNKAIPTDEHIFMCMVGASGTGKTRLILSMLTEFHTFYPPFRRIIYVYRHWQPIFDKFNEQLGPSVITFIQLSVDNPFEFIDTLTGNQGGPNTKWLLIFDDSCEEILQSAEFANLATSGRHKGLNTIFIKHNLYQQGKHSVTVDKNTTHIIIMKTPRIGKQLRLLGSEIDGITSDFLEKCYKNATKNRYGHLLIDVSPACNDLLRFASNIGGLQVTAEPTVFWQPPYQGRSAEYVESETTNQLAADLPTVALYSSVAAAIASTSSLSSPQ